MDHQVSISLLNSFRRNARVVTHNLDRREVLEHDLKTVGAGVKLGSMEGETMERAEVGREVFVVDCMGKDSWGSVEECLTVERINQI